MSGAEWNTTTALEKVVLLSSVTGTASERPINMVPLTLKLVATTKVATVQMKAESVRITITWGLPWGRTESRCSPGEA